MARGRVGFVQVVVLATLMALGAMPALAQESAAAAGPVDVTVRLQEVKAVTLADGRDGVDVVLDVALAGWTGESFPDLLARLVGYLPAGPVSFDPVATQVIERRSSQEGVVSFQFVRPAGASYMTIFAGLPSVRQGDETTQVEGWSGVVFTEADVR